jgi:hypothetical protein
MVHHTTRGVSLRLVRRAVGLVVFVDKRLDIFSVLLVAKLMSCLSEAFSVEREFMLHVED